ncbi:MAG: hypothetical protein ACTSYA_09840 [Candidatus Kariarchaeaceae archaeon]
MNKENAINPIAKIPELIPLLLNKNIPFLSPPFSLLIVKSLLLNEGYRSYSNYGHKLINFQFNSFSWGFIKKKKVI